MSQRITGLKASAADDGRAKKDTAGTRRMLELIRQVAPFEQGIVVSMLPRGGMRLLQPANLPATFVKAYARYGHSHDLVAWSAILKGQAVRGSDCWTEQQLTKSPHHREFLAPSGLNHALAIPLSGPVLAGYPGALIVLRNQRDPDFSAVELDKLKDMGGVLDEYLHVERPVRAMEQAAQTDPWNHTAAVRCFIFNHEGKLIFPAANRVVPPQVEAEMREQAGRILERLKRRRDLSKCVDLTDDHGENWPFRFTGAAAFPALGEGPVVFASLLPEGFEWSQVQPWEVAADEELVRILPTMQFMQQESATGPSLEDIAREAKFSRFHFLRRFSDLVGRTPKQFLVSCQIHEAKRLLVRQPGAISQIAADCGFAEQSHFANRFRETTGLTPTRWRQRAAKLVREL